VPVKSLHLRLSAGPLVDEKIDVLPDGHNAGQHPALFALPTFVRDLTAPAASAHPPARLAP